LLSHHQGSARATRAAAFTTILDPADSTTRLDPTLPYPTLPYPTLPLNFFTWKITTVWPRPSRLDSTLPYPTLPYPTPQLFHLTFRKIHQTEIFTKDRRECDRLSPVPHMCQDSGCRQGLMSVGVIFDIADCNTIEKKTFFTQGVR
jgi:hypothetical protein